MGEEGNNSVEDDYKKLAEILALTCMYVRMYIPTCETRLT